MSSKDVRVFFPLPHCDIIYLIWFGEDLWGNLSSEDAQVFSFIPFSSRVIDIINPSARTLGSSEGKESAAKKEGQEEGEDEEELPIVKGSFVFIHSGRHRGTYGVVSVSLLSLGHHRNKY